MSKSDFYLDATKITNFNCSDSDLELHILFWVCAAGKNGVTSARCLCNLLNYYSNHEYLTPFSIIRRINEIDDLALVLKNFGIGCYRGKAATMLQLATSNINLKNCTVDDLESIKGIGPKTARCFLIHSRPNQRFAGLDIHILRYLSDQGINVPKVTPAGRRYKELEKEFIRLADKQNMSISELDLKIWNIYRVKL